MRMSWEVLQLFLPSDKRNGRGEGYEGQQLLMEVHLTARRKALSSYTMGDEKQMRIKLENNRISPNYPTSSETPSLLK